MRVVIFHPSQEKLNALDFVTVGAEVLAMDLRELAVKAGASDGIALAGNSYGIMDGGIDLVAVQVYGLQLQTRIQQRITLDYAGELPVGCAIALPAATYKPNAMILYAPSMSVPMDIRGTDNVYRATAAALREAEKGRCATLYLPLFGELTGRVPLPAVGAQMAAAINHHRRKPSVDAMTWAYAAQRHAQHMERRER